MGEDTTSENPQSPSEISVKKWEEILRELFDLKDTDKKFVNWLTALNCWRKENKGSSCTVMARKYEWKRWDILRNIVRELGDWLHSNLNKWGIDGVLQYKKVFEKEIEEEQKRRCGFFRICCSWTRGKSGEGSDILTLYPNLLDAMGAPEFKSRWPAIPLKEGTNMKILLTLLPLLQESKNLILTGAPGTGKTHLAKELALRLILGKPEGELTEDEMDKMDKNKGEYRERWDFVQFHPSYDYTDFVEGLRPMQDDKGNIGFARKDGVFKAFCKNAADAVKDKGAEPDKYVFIIDEINRGEISKIFGELFFSIDPGYRGKDGLVKTQYHNLIDDGDPFKDGFYVPENVYIIGTMNDIDRSVESFDFAMRRRFVWKEITAAESAKNMPLSNDCINKMTALNDAITSIKELGQSFHIGGAYFLKDGEAVTNFDNLWKWRLEPLLKEYLRGMPKAHEELKNLEKAYNGKTKDADSSPQNQEEVSKRA